MVSDVRNYTYTQTCTAGDHFFVKTTGDDTNVDIVRKRNVIKNVDDTRDRSDETEHWRYAGNDSQIARVSLHHRYFNVCCRLHERLDFTHGPTDTLQPR